MSSSRRKTRPHASHPVVGSVTVAPQPDSPTPVVSPTSAALLWLLAAALGVITVAVFGPTVGHGFVSLDDYIYVTDNRHVLGGLSWQGVAWALTTTHANFWHPLTWLSLMLDVQIFGAGAAGFHVTNLVLHLASVLLLFVTLARMTGAAYPSAFAAALFAVHPLHAESVAWISERKDVLSTFFMMLTLWAYAGYVDRTGSGAGRRAALRYAAVLVLFGLGLAAKPMLVTLPFVLLLLDWWPLARLSRGLRGPIVEKVPLFVLALASGAVAFLAQRSGGAVAGLEAFPLSARAVNALTSYTAYIGKTLWPTGLVPFYPYPQTVAFGLAAAALTALAAASVAVLLQARRRPYLAVGWFWYLGTMLPVSGLVQVGSHSMADRYTYVPLIGLFVMVAWAGREWADGLRARRAIAATASCMIVLTAAVAARQQVMTWKDSGTLWQHAVTVAPNNYYAHYALGLELLRQGRKAEAASHFAESTRLAPGFPNGLNSLGQILAEQGRIDEAIAKFRAAIQRDPRYVQARINLGNALREKGSLADAIDAFTRAIEVSADSSAARANLGTVLLDAGRPQEALAQARQAVELKPDSADAHFALANALSRVGQLPRAVEHYQEALRLPGQVAAADIRLDLGAALERLGRFDDALAQVEEVLRRSPHSAEAHNNLGKLLLRTGRPGDAEAHFKEAVAIRPAFGDAYMNLGSALADLGRLEEAERAHRRAVELDPQSADAHLNLANTCYARGQLADAVAHYTRTLQLEGPSADVHAALGLTLERLGRRDEARAHYVEALRLQPDHHEASAGLSRLAGSPARAGRR